MNMNNMFSDFTPKMQFSNRVDSLEFIDKKISNYAQLKKRIYCFKGVGGQGKSRLCSEAISKSIQSHKDILIGNCSFIDEQNLDIPQLLQNLRASFGKNSKVKFPAFDIGYLLFNKIKRPNVSIEPKEDIVETYSDFVKEIFMLAESFVAKNSYVGLVYEVWQLIKFKSKKTLTRSTRTSLDKFLNAIGNDEYGADLSKMLVDLFVEDLIKSVEKSKKQKKILFFIDEYERIWGDEFYSFTKYSEIDEVLTELAYAIDSSLWFLFSREKLSEQWINHFSLSKEFTHVDLKGLPIKDATSLLKKEPIKDKGIIKSMINFALDPKENRVNPFLLEFLIRHYNQILSKQERTPELSDFLNSNIKKSNRLLELTKRFLRDVGENLRRKIEILAVSKKFNETIYKLFFPDWDDFQDWLTIKNLSFVNNLDGNYFTLKHHYREAIVNSLPSEFIEKISLVLVEYHSSKAFESENDKITKISFLDYTDTIYYFCNYNVVDSINWFYQTNSLISESGGNEAVLKSIEILRPNLVRLKKHKDDVELQLKYIEATCYRKLSKDKKSKIRYNEIIEKINNSKNKNLETIFSCLFGLGVIYVKEDDIKSVKTCIEEMEKIISDTSDDKIKQDYISSLDYLKAFYFEEIGFFETAYSLYSKSSFFTLNKEGRSKYYFKKRRNTIGVLMSLGRFSQAEMYLEELLLVYEEIYTKKHYQFWMINLEYLNLYLAQQRLKEAAATIKFLLKGLSSSNYILSLKDVITFKLSEAEYLMFIKEYGKSFDIYKQFIPEMVAKLGENYFPQNLPRLNFANLLVNLNKTNEAYKIIKNSINLLSKSSIPKNIGLIGRFEMVLANIEFTKKNYEKSYVISLSSKKKLIEAYGEDHFEVAEIYKQINIISLVISKNENDTYKNRIIEIFRSTNFDIRLRSNKQWTKIPKEQIQNYKNFIANDLLTIDDISETDIYVASLKNIFRDQIELVKFNFSKTKIPLSIFGIRHKNNFIKINGTGYPLKRLLQLTNKKINVNNVTNYLWLFNETIFAEEGHKFMICETINDIDWRKDYNSLELKKEIKTKLNKIKIIEKKADKDKLIFIVNANLIYRGDLLLATYQVTSNGEVGMNSLDIIDEKYLDLPVLSNIKYGIFYIEETNE